MISDPSRRLLLTVAPLLLALPGYSQVIKECSKSSYGTIPLTDLGLGTHFGQQGGLYPGGSNVLPVAHELAGIQIAENDIVPRDVDGNPDPAGIVGLVSIGFSNTSREFRRFIELLGREPNLHPSLVAVDCAKGSLGLEDAVDPNDPNDYWPYVGNQLSNAEVTGPQVQVAWLEIGYLDLVLPYSFPAWQIQEQQDLTKFVRSLKRRMPNLRLCYVTSRIYGHYSQRPELEEPAAYESAFGFKWMIEDQMAGPRYLNYDPAKGPERAPWIAWAPYNWADGIVPRSDGLTWRCSNFEEDGVHPSSSGTRKVATVLLDFFRNDTTTRPWFLRAGTQPGPSATIE